MKVSSLFLIRSVVAFLCTSTIQPAFSQIPDIEWGKCFGGSNNEFAYSIEQIKYDGFLIAGSAQSNDGQLTENHGGEDYWVVIIDKNGKLKLQKSLGGSHSDEAYSGIETTDGGYVIAGSSQSDDGDISNHHGTTSYADCWLVKLNERGKIKWEKSFGGTKTDKAHSVRQTSDGGYIVAGEAWSNDGDVTGYHGFDGADFWIVKLDPTGNIEWQKALGGNSGDYAHAVTQTKDGGYIVAGYTFSTGGDVIGNHGGTDDWVVKLDAFGNIEWKNCYGGSYDDAALSIEQTADEGYIVGGYSNSDDGDASSHYGFHDQPDYWILKLDHTGNIEWQKSLGGYGSDRCRSIEQTNDLGYILTGPCYSKDGGDVTGHHGHGGSVYSDYWVVRLDSMGSLLWQKSMGGWEVDEAKAVRQTNDGGYVVAGSAGSHKGDVMGNHGPQYSNDYWIVKFSSEPQLKTNLFTKGENNLIFDQSGSPQILKAAVEYNESINTPLQLYPNPTTGSFTVKLPSSEISDSTLCVTIIDILGKQVLQRKYAVINLSLGYAFELNSAFDEGMYILKVEAGERSWQQTFVVNR